jgi:hypothetical protein
VQIALQKGPFSHCSPLLPYNINNFNFTPQSIINLSFFIAFIVKAMASSSSSSSAAEVQFITVAGREVKLSTNPCPRYDPDIEAEDMPFKP